MPTVELDGVTICYDVAGEGPPLVYTEGAWAGRTVEGSGVCMGRYAASHRVLIWDRPNCGSSGVVADGSENEFVMCAEYLHWLLTELSMTPAVVVGGSGGLVISLALASVYPQDVRALMIDSPPSDSPQLLQGLADMRYLHLAQTAADGGMQTAYEWLNTLRSEPEYPGRFELMKWVAECVKYPSNRESFLSFDPGVFEQTCRRWARSFASDQFFKAGLTDTEVEQITCPAFIMPGFYDHLHPEHTAEKLHSLLPQSEFRTWSECFSAHEINEMKGWAAAGQFQAIRARALLIQQDFLNRI